MSWGTTLISALDAAVPVNWSAVENLPRNWAVSGATVASLKSSIDSLIAVHDANSETSNYVFLMNLGANDASGLPAEATWKANYQYMIDALIVKYHTAKIYIAKPWRRNMLAACNLMAGYIDDLIAANPTTCFAGHDERTWLEGGDDGATMTYDGIHYSTAGLAECAAQWQTILGY